MRCGRRVRVSHGLALEGTQAVVERHIKPFLEEQAEVARRAEQTRIFRRNQAVGLVLIAMAILVLWLFRTNPRWIFPPGWWRL